MNLPSFPRSDILRARRAVAKAMKLAGPIVGTTDFLYAQNYLRKLLDKAPRQIRAPGEEGVAVLKRKADNLFSIVVRLSAATSNGMVKCYTCSTILHWKGITNGHYVKRQYRPRYNRKNCKPQCTYCNYNLQGNDAIFRANLVTEYGENEVLILESKKGKTGRWQRWELQQIIKDCEQMIPKLKAQINE